MNRPSSIRTKTRWYWIGIAAVLIAAGVAITIWIKTQPRVRTAQDPVVELITDDRRDEEEAYQVRLKGQVQAILDGSSSEDPKSVAASLHELPTAGLPMLQSAISDGTVSGFRAELIKSALKGESVRLHSAIATQKRLEWFRKTTQVPFEIDSAKEPWTPTARFVIHTATLVWANDPRASGDESQILWREGRSCFRQQCGEPLALMAYIQNLMELDPGQQNFASINAVLAAHNMNLAHYGPAWKMTTCLLAAKSLADFKPVPQSNQQEIDRLVEKSRDFFPSVLLDRLLPRQELLNLFELIGNASVSIYQDRRTLAAPMFEQLQASRVDPSTVLTIQGAFNVEYAWDARGQGWSSTVSQNGEQLMEERLAKADTALEKAWELDPTNSDAATKMIGVELGQGQGRDRMELWFHRAMDADPDNYEACVQKLYYLEPKWYGGSQAMLAFGHECEAGGNWNAGIPYILVSGTLALAHYNDSGWQGAPQPAYFTANPSAWDDVLRITTKDQQYRPLSMRKELELARLATWTSHWTEARKAFDIAGASSDSRVFTDPELKQAILQAHNNR